MRRKETSVEAACLHVTSGIDTRDRAAAPGLTPGAALTDQSEGQDPKAATLST